MAQSGGKTKASVLLDLIRGIAAVLVLVEHWRNIFFVDYGQILSAHRVLFAPFYLVAGTGHQAVMIFFVLSGYLISGSVFRLIERDSWKWSLYFTHRLLRLWIVLLPGLVLCFVWDAIGLHSGRAPLLYSGLAGNHTIPNVGAQHGWMDFVRNLFFLQGVTGPTYGSNGALWSLSYEFWYYVLFPLGLFAVLRTSKMGVRVISLIGFLAVAYFVRGPILEYFAIWLLGTVMAKVPPPRVGLGGRVLAAVVYVPIYLAFAKADVILPMLGKRVPVTLLEMDYVLGVITAVFFWVMLSATQKAQPSRGVDAATELSRFSYTLYLVHTPLLVVIAAYAVGDARWQPTPVYLAYGLAVLVGGIAYAYGVAWLTEFRTDKVRKLIERRFFGMTAAAKRV